jgi:predicted RNase H-like HicB family nuclease
MSRYAYPAIFTPEKDGGFSVDFPDLEGCHTCGDNLADAIIMSEDVLALILYGYEHDGKQIPKPSDTSKLHLEAGEFINFISCDTLAYRKRYGNKSVKKTLTIPEWLNESATAMGINFSQVLQEALIQKLETAKNP